MELKVKQIRNSVGVILPKEMVSNMNIEKGDTLWVNEVPSGYNITPYDPIFSKQMDAARKIMKNRRNVLRELAK